MGEFPLTFDAPFFVCMSGCLSVYSKQGAAASDFECPACSTDALAKALEYARRTSASTSEGDDRG